MASDLLCAIDVLPLRLAITLAAPRASAAGRTLALFVLVLAVAPAVAQDHGQGGSASDPWILQSAPVFLGAAQTQPAGDASWLSMRCEGDRPRYMQVRCTFHRTSITPPADAHLRRQLEALDRDITPDLRDADLAPMRRACAGDPQASTLCRCVVPAGDGGTPRLRRDCLRRELRRVVEAQARACRISHVSFTVGLERVARTQWSGTLLDAPCGDAVTIRIDTNEAFTAWTFTQMMVAAGRGSDPSCGARATGSVTRFDSAARNLVPLACAGFVPQ